MKKTIPRMTLAEKRSADFYAQLEAGLGRGWHAVAPPKNGKGNNWRVQIEAVSQCRRYVKVKGRAMSGKAWWMAAKDLTNHRPPSPPQV